MRDDKAMLVKRLSRSWIPKQAVDRNIRTSFKDLKLLVEATKNEEL